MSASSLPPSLPAAVVVSPEHEKVHASILRFLAAHTNDIIAHIADVVDGGDEPCTFRDDKGSLESVYGEHYSTSRMLHLRMQVFTPFETKDCVSKVNVKKLSNLINNRFQKHYMLMGFWIENVTVTYEAAEKQLVLSGEINGCE